MTNELVVIDPKNALSVLTSSDYVDKLIIEVGEKVKNLDGGSMETGVGRKAIISNANKAKKSKTALNKIIDDLISAQKDRIEDKTKDERLTIEQLKENKNRLGNGLDGIYKTTRQEVTDFESELKRIKEEKEAIEAAENLRIQVEADHEIALLLNEKFDRDAEDKLKKEQETERLRFEQEEQARIEREDQIRKEAVEKAKADSKKEKEQLIIDNAHGEALLINRDIDYNAEQIALAKQKKIDDEKAEQTRLDDIEDAKQAEQKRIFDEAASAKADEEKRKADEEHYKKLMNETFVYLCEIGTPIIIARRLVKDLRDGAVPNVPKMVF